MQLMETSTTATGHGPAWIAPPFVTPLKKWIEKLASTFGTLSTANGHQLTPPQTYAPCRG